jgi:hypothetical protein
MTVGSPIHKQTASCLLAYLRQMAVEVRKIHVPKITWSSDKNYGFFFPLMVILVTSQSLPVRVASILHSLH